MCFDEIHIQLLIGSKVADFAEDQGARGKFVDRILTYESKRLKRVPGLRKLSVLDPGVFPMATNFKVTPEEGRILLGIIRRLSPLWPINSIYD